MKTVFDNRQLAHVWAQQTQPTGHSNSMSFDGPVLYSYQTPIACIYPDTHPDRFNVQGRVVLVASETYSRTTSGKHIPAMYRALRGGEMYFAVPHVLTDSRDGYNGARHSLGRATVGTHDQNLEYLRVEFDKEAKRQERTRDYSPERMRYLAIDCDAYARAFGLESLEQSTVVCPAREQEISALRAARRLKRETPAYLAKKALEDEQRARRHAENARLSFAREAERRGEWLAGGTVPWYGTDEGGGAYLRLMPDRVETSQGAHVPLADARRAITFIRLQRDHNSEWRDRGIVPRGYVPVGAFKVDHIAANGDIKAGCHFIRFAEIDKIGKLLGV